MNLVALLVDSLMLHFHYMFSSFLGILVIQDIFLGIMLAILPILKQFNQNRAGFLISPLFFLILDLFLMLSFCVIFMKIFAVHLLRFLNHLGKELLLLGSVAILLLFCKVAEYFGLSVELGCFCCGFIVSFQPNSTQLMGQLVQPLRDLFSCFFFLSIGFHIYPSFLFQEAYFFVTLAFAIMTLKFIINFSLLKGYFRQDGFSSLFVSTGVSQISEFAFVLASRAKSLGLLRREMYYIILGTAALSLFLHPLLNLAFRYHLKSWKRKYSANLSDSHNTYTTNNPINMTTRSSGFST
eukprot:Sdes_comp20222_c0_seq1m13601